MKNLKKFIAGLLVMGVLSSGVVVQVKDSAKEKQSKPTVCRRMSVDPPTIPPMN